MRTAILTGIVALGVGVLGTNVAVNAVAGGGSGTTNAVLASSSSQKAPRLVVVGLTDHQRLVAFQTNRPEVSRTIGKISGLMGADNALVGIDYRVQDGKLYGVGDAGGVYTINTVTAKVTKVSQLSVAMQGTSFGVDFNPAANRLRVISDTGQNLRHNIDDPNGAPAAGMTATDGTLVYPPATTAAGVTGAAYTNNDLDPSTATTLFDLDTMQDQVAIQSPANAGSLAATGKLGVDAGSSAGFDIYTTLGGGTSTGTVAFATLQVDGRYGFYRVSTLTGAVKKIGNFDGRNQVVDIAIPLAQ